MEKSRTSTDGERLSAPFRSLLTTALIFYLFLSPLLLALGLALASRQEVPVFLLRFFKDHLTALDKFLRITGYGYQLATLVLAFQVFRLRRLLKFSYLKWIFIYLMTWPLMGLHIFWLLRRAERAGVRWETSGTLAHHE